MAASVFAWVEAPWGLPSQPLLLAAVVALALLLLWLRWPWLSGRFPRASALLWPHLPVGLLLLGVASALFTGLVFVTSWLWREPAHHWESLTGAMAEPWCSWAGLFDWLWPWFPTLLVFFPLLFLAATSLSRRLFHAVALTSLVALTLGVVLHAERPEPPFTVHDSHSVQEVAGERVTERILQPLFHREDLEADFSTTLVMGGLLLLGYSWLDRRNLQRTIQPIRVAYIEDERNAEGKPRTRPDLENLMRECLLRHAPHTPPPLPGGTLGYWQDFVEQQSVKDTHWLTRAAAVVMRFLRPPAGLELSGTLIRAGEEAGAPRHGIRIHLVDLRTGQTQLARTFLSTTSLERAIQQAANAAVERAIEQCRVLPEWAYWEEGDGSALWRYYRGVSWLRKGAAEKKNANKARMHLEKAAQGSPGSAIVRLQLAESLEACGDYVGALEIYLQVCARYPRLLVAKVRLASVFRSATEWAARLDESQEQHPTPRQRLMEALEGGLARKLRRPTRLSRRIERTVRGRCPHLSKLPRIRRGHPIHFDPGDTERLRDALFNMADTTLRQLERAGRWHVLAWCFASTADRRLFWHTLLWPPQKRRDAQLSLKIARRCVQWRQLHRLGELYHQEGAARSSRFFRCLLQLARLRLRLQKAACQRRVARASRQTGLAVRIHPNWLGAAHYHLACFYSVCLDAELRQLPELYPLTEDWARKPRLDASLLGHASVHGALAAFKEAATPWLEWSKKVDEVLQATRENSTPPGYDINSGERDVVSERAWVLGSLGELMEQAAETGRGLPRRSQHLCRRLARHSAAILREYRRALRELWPPEASVLQRLRSLADCLQPFPDLGSLLSHELHTFEQRQPMSTQHEAQYERWVYLQETLTALQGLLDERAAQAPALAACARELAELRPRVQELLTRQHRVRDLDRLAAKLKGLPGNIRALQRLCTHAERARQMSRCACDHLSHSMRDRDGPFSTGTKKWLLNYPDLEALRPQRGFESWTRVTLLQRREEVLHRASSHA